jgi:hypothetical protein
MRPFNASSIAAEFLSFCYFLAAQGIFESIVGVRCFDGEPGIGIAGPSAA